MWAGAIFLVLFAGFQAYATGAGGLPVDKVYGVNLGSWLVLEPWMLPNEWVQMGGDTCFETGSCADCAASEFDLVKKLGQQKADEVFQQHWETWFNQQDVQNMVNAGLNTVRIPVGYWIVEALVNRATEFYPRGGIKQLQRGLAELGSAGIHALLDFHALPGVSSANQMFAGHCTSDVEFYTPQNYFRALQWGAVMTFVSHADPAFSSVFGIEAVNEPIMNPNMTPGYGDYLTDFTLVVRAMELALGILCPGVDYRSLLKFGGSLANLTSPVNVASDATSKVNINVGTTSNSPSLNVPSLTSLASGLGGRVADVLLSVIPIIESVAFELGVDNPLGDGSKGRFSDGVNRQCLHVTYMDVLWQGLRGPNPADSAAGPALFDDHLCGYFNFGGVASPDPQAYLTTICNLPRVKNDTDLRNLPLVFGEWAISTNFDATEQFLTQWADAQKLMYSQSSGWIFWSFKIENGNSNQREWDYFTALDAGHFTRDPAQLNDPHVCDSYRK